MIEHQLFPRYVALAQDAYREQGAVAHSARESARAASHLIWSANGARQYQVKRLCRVSRAALRAAGESAAHSLDSGRQSLAQN
ncbi:MAG: hypothetical protein ACRDTV_17475 [Mycobacterium sp.]